MNHYFECKKINGPLVVLSTLKELPITNKCKLVDVKDKTTQLYIKHIGCCFINKKGDKSDIVEEISKDIKDLVNCLDVDFSSIVNIQDLDELCIPELDFNYSAHYTNKLYNV